MVEKDDRASHDTKHVDSDVGVRDKALCVHIEACVGHNREDFSEALAGNRDLLRGEDLSEGLREKLHHGGGVRKEEREAVRELIFYAKCGVLFGHFHSAEIPAIKREIILNGRRCHFCLVEFYRKVDKVAELLGRRLLLCNALFGRLRRVAQRNNKRGKHTLDFLRELVEARDFVHTGQHRLPRSVLCLGRGRRDGLADKVVAPFVRVERL